MSLPVASDAGERFARDLIAALGAEPEGVIGLAVSGGPDSMALLALAQTAFPRGVAVATFDHHLRPQSADEAALVAIQCAALEVPHVTLRPITPITGASLQAAARAARYAALGEWGVGQGLTCIVTAHHADDQAETFLMRAARGSGLAGLAGIRSRAMIAGAIVVRPLLKWRRAELRSIVRRAELPFVDDPANRDPRHDRTRFRLLLEGNEWLDPPALARAACHLGEAEADLGALVDLLVAERVEISDDAVLVRGEDLPPTAGRAVLREAILLARERFRIACPAFDRASNIEPLLAALAGGRAATQAGLRIAVVGTNWQLQPAPPRRSH